MNLIYVNEIGADYKGQRQYEFIFSKFDEFDMDSCLSIPASIDPENKIPDIEYISLVGLLKDSDLELELVQNSDYFGVIDAVDGIISLAWEKFVLESEEERLYFRFGDTMDKVVKKLNTRDLYLINEEIQ
jgi:hypothetical protein